MMAGSYSVAGGEALPLGVHECCDGVNLAVFSRGNNNAYARCRMHECGALHYGVMATLSTPSR